MLFKNSMLLLTAITAGSAVARMHGHERRHAAFHAREEEKRAVGDMVTATINGKVVSWVNEYAGGAAPAATADDSVSAPTADVQAAAAAAATVETSSTAAETDDAPTAVPVSSAPGSCSNWHDTPGDYTREGFGGQTAANFLKYIDYKGNVGNPWGSNIIEVAPEKACQYKYVVRFEGPRSGTWTVVFWNKMGPDGLLTGWYGNSALKLTINPGETKYVAFDEDSQGAWGAAKGNELPTDAFGGYSCTWGEFDFGSKKNNDWSGWDVSAIQVQFANQPVQGMKICDYKNEGCSFVTNLATKLVNAYSKFEEGVDGIGGRQVPGPVRLITHIDYEE
ncbi:hypothetical protein BJX61DRAFT_91168 [Aspergillus egyptiacus]|nr:hypothetical protein BJX61DRAFT_91168 [Aspergillus egyptiacus]